MSDYKQVTVETARGIGETFEKSVVIICSFDPVYRLLHTTTWGKEPRDKSNAAIGGDIVTKALGFMPEAKTEFADYRLDQAKKLLTALKSVVALAEETRGAWDNDQDMRVGKILRALGDPKVKGYRADIDAIHATIKEAEKFIDL